MKFSLKKLAAVLICLVLAAVLTVGLTPTGVQAAHYNSYNTLSMIYNYNGCYSMQGMAVYGNYIYCAKIDSDTDALAILTRTNRTTGATDYLYNGSSGSTTFTNLGHANDLAVGPVVGTTTMFVTTCTSGSNSIVRYVIEGNKATKVGNYTVTVNGSPISFGGISFYHVDSDYVTLMIKSGRYFYTGKIGVNQSSGTIPLTLQFTIDIADVNINGTKRDLSNFLHQGFEYHDGRVYVPMSGDTIEDTSAIVVYDITGVYSTLKNNPDLTFWIESSEYPALFEIESCGISHLDGRMYFNTNSRVTDSATNYDGVHYIKNFVHNPSGRTAKVDNYRWEMIGDTLVPVTTGGATYNGLTMHYGKVSSGVINTGSYYTWKNVLLQHDMPWIVEWKCSGAGSSSMLFCSEQNANRVGSNYLFRTAGSGLVLLGTFDGSKNHNYGLKLSSYGIDGTATHVYRLTNKINSDGSNMVYLSVDGKELGPMNNYYVGINSQGTTSNWVSGKDFKFSYIGAMNYPLSNYDLDYIHVYGNGIYSQVDEPNIYRWETQSGKLTSITGCGLTTNNPTVLGGTCSSVNKYSNMHMALDKNVVLRHDRAWSVEWRSTGSFTGSTMLLSSHNMGNAMYSPYLLRAAGSSIIAFGSKSGSGNTNFGINLADHGIDGTGTHVFRLTNRLNSDGSNMVYLYVDGKELGPMNNTYLGVADQKTKSDWISGKDFSFNYLGTGEYPINDGYISHLQVWENGIPAEHTPTSYRWETKNNVLTTQTSGYTYNPAEALTGTCTSGVYSKAHFRLRKSVVLLHNEPWRITWQSTGDMGGTGSGAMMFAQTNVQNEYGSVYIYRQGGSGLLAIGVRETGVHCNFGLILSDYGIDDKLTHTYELRNRIASNGSNMVYLFVDGVEIGPMNNYYQGLTSQNKPYDWISGKDFTFSYMGTRNYLIHGTSYGFIEVNETCVHSYTEGVCVYCGAKDPNYVPPVPESTLVGKNFSLSFEDEILVNFYYAAENCDIAQTGMLVYTEDPGTADITTAHWIYSKYTYLADSGLYMVQTDGIAAKNMGDSLYFAAYAQLTDGSFIYSPLYDYSPKKYATNTLNRAGSSDSMKALCVAMLNYGAAAQEYFGYRTDDLMNAALTAEQKALVANYDASYFSGAVAVAPDKIGSFGATAGFSGKSASVSFEGAFAINYYFAPGQSVDDQITFYYWTPEDYAAASALSTSNASGKLTMKRQDNGSYWAQLSGIPAKAIDSTYYVAGVYTSETQIRCTGVVAYSLSKYCLNNAKPGNAMQDLAAATAMYGYYADAYFAG